MTKPVNFDKLLYTPVEAAHALGLSRSTIYVLVANGRVPSVRTGNYEVNVRRHIVPVIGNRTLAKLSPADVQGLINIKRGEGPAPSTVPYVHATLRAAPGRGPPVGPGEPQRRHAGRAGVGHQNSGGTVRARRVQRHLGGGGRRTGSAPSTRRPRGGPSPERGVGAEMGRRRPVRGIAPRAAGPRATWQGEVPDQPPHNPPAAGVRRPVDCAPPPATFREAQHRRVREKRSGLLHTRRDAVGQDRGLPAPSPSSRSRPAWPTTGSTTAATPPPASCSPRVSPPASSWKCLATPLSL